MMHRVIIHWTAGGSRANATDREHYHRLVEYDGTIIAGTESVADNIVTSDGDYAAHTRNLNTGSIGVAMCGMRGAVEYPFDAGPSPLTEKQFRACAILVADLCREYSIPVTRRTVLFHAEVQPTLGVKQRGKWDVTRLPFRPDLVGALAVGDHFRELVSEVAGVISATSRPTLRVGNRTPRADVRALQTDLAAIGYPSGKADGLFGPLLRRAVMGFQADHGLMTDGVFGPASWAKLDKAQARPLREHTEQTLADAGSTTIINARKAEKALTTTEGVTVAGMSVGGMIELSAAASRAEGALEVAQRMLIQYWPIILMGVVILIVTRYGKRVARAIKLSRLADAITGRNLGR